MAVVDRRSSALPVPYAVELPDRLRKERYFDPDFYQTGGRAAVVAGLADGLPARGDPAAGRFRRVRDPRPVHHRGAHRRRGVAGVPERLPPSWRQGRRRVGGRARPGSSALSTGGATARTAGTPSSHGRRRSPSTTLRPRTSTSRRCGARSGAGARGSTSTTTLRRSASASSHSPPSSTPGRWSRMRAEWWYACRLPVNWKLAEEAFMEQYHVVETHPQLVIPGMRYPPGQGGIDPRAFIDAEIHYLRTMSEGMAGMVHAERRARRRRSAGTWSCRLTPARPCRPGTARSTTRSCNGTGPRGATSPTSTSSRPGDSTSPWATASRTTSCCRCTAAPPPTGSARWGPRRR